MERVIIFIDGSNFYHGLKEEMGKAAIDFANFIRMLCGERQLVRAYYYNAPVNQYFNPQQYKAQQKFFSGLKSIPFLDLELGRLEKRVLRTDVKYLTETFGEEVANKIIEKWGDKIITFVEKGVDINIAVDMLRFAYANIYDTAILVSGDGDFAVAIEAVKDLGKHVEVAYFSRQKSYHIMQACDKFIPLGKNNLSSFMLKK